MSEYLFLHSSQLSSRLRPDLLCTRRYLLRVTWGLFGGAFRVRFRGVFPSRSKDWKKFKPSL